MPLLPLIVAAKNARDLIHLARKALEHYRHLPPLEQERLRGEADRLRTLSTEFAAATSQSVRRRIGASPEQGDREAKVIATDLRDALARFSGSAAQEVAVVAKGESRKMHYAARAVGFGARRLDRTRTTTSGDVAGIADTSIARSSMPEPQGRQEPDHADAAAPATSKHGRPTPR